MKADCIECLKYNNGCTVKEITIRNGKCLNELRDSVKYYQHKYLRGILLPEISQAMGEQSIHYLHNFILKPRYLTETIGHPFYQYEDFNDIPEKFQSSGNIWRLDSGQWAVIPSMSRFTIKEAKSYIEFCERVLFIDLNGSISKCNESEYKELKARLK